ncbi:hypothetical protein EB001_11325 [bacterium]|nr:hypothetical protein [bacterium]
METKTKTNSIESLLKKTVGEFTVDELNVLFYNLYSFTVYSANNEYFIMYDIDNYKPLNKKCTLFYYIKEAKVVYEHYLEISNKRKITNEFKKLLDL